MTELLPVHFTIPHIESDMMSHSDETERSFGYDGSAVKLHECAMNAQPRTLVGLGVKMI